MVTFEANQIRLLDLSVDDGPTQLALSEAIMHAVGQGIAPPTLRLYSWSEPVVIIGVGQPVSDVDLEHCQQMGYRVLRRIGGGTAVFHDEDEVSVDLIVPSGHRLALTDVHAGYRQFAELLETALARMDIPTAAVSVDDARRAERDPILQPFCFGSISPHEFVSGGKKLNGLCQIRRRDVIAYQSAIYRRFKVEPLVDALRHESDEVRANRARRLRDSVIDLATLGGGDVDYRRFQAAISETAAKMFALAVRSVALTDWEGAETRRLIDEKYANEDWTFRR